MIVVKLQATIQRKLSLNYLCTHVLIQGTSEEVQVIRQWASPQVTNLTSFSRQIFTTLP